MKLPLLTALFLSSLALTAIAEVSPAEMQVLVKHYRWKKDGEFLVNPSLEEICKVMDDCADNTLELEDYDWQARKAVALLMVIGDKRFAKELDGRAVSVQREVVLMIKPLWEKYGLRYPETERIAAALKYAE